jgi:hypothetical protein
MQPEVRILNDLTEWIEAQKERNELAAEVTFTSYKFESILDILEQSVEAMHTLLNHGIGSRNVLGIG